MGNRTHKRLPSGKQVSSGLEVEITSFNVKDVNVKPSRFLWICLSRLILAAGFAFAGCKKSAGTAPGSVTAASGQTSTAASDIDPKYGNLLHAQPKLPTVKVWLGDQILDTEIARNRVEIATGMMFRTNTPEDQAMIFVFPYPSQQAFYMRNCPAPLSGAYISPDGEILEIIQMKAHDETPIPSKSENVQFVLETAAGWFDRHHIGVGARVRTERGSLMETFFPDNGAAR